MSLWGRRWIGGGAVTAVWEKFSYGVFDRVGTLLFSGVITWILASLVVSTAAAPTPGGLGAAAGIALGDLLLLGFTYMRWTSVVADERGLRLQVLAFTRKKIGWSQITKVRRGSIGRGMVSIDVFGPDGKRAATVPVLSCISDIGDFDRLTAIISERAKTFGFALYSKAVGSREACQTDEERRAYDLDGGRVDRL